MRPKSSGKLRFNRLCSIILIAMMILSGLVIVATENVLADQDGDYTYTVSDGKAKITDYTGAGGEITVPDILGGYPVFSIGTSAFSACNSLTSVTISNGISVLDAGAFIGCSSLTSVIIPSSVSVIQDYAFAFCPSLTTISVDPSNADFIVVEGMLYNKTMTTLLQCSGGKAGSFNISDSVRTIADGAFAGCFYLTSIALPNNLTRLGDESFGGTSLISLTIPNKVTSIGSHAFYNCPSLVSVTMGENVTSIGEYAFGFCPSLEYVIFNALVAPKFVGSDWIYGTNTSIRGYVDPASDFPTRGGSFYGLIIGGFTNPLMPGAPTELIASGGNREIELSWNPPVDDGGADIDYYVIFQDEVALSSFVEGLTAVITDLNVNQSYSFTVSAHNYAGLGNQSDLASATTFTFPDAPTGLTATAGNGEITLSWSEPVFDGGATIDYYVVYQDNVRVSETTTNLSIIISGLVSGRAYSFSVVAHSEVGIGKVSEPIIATPTETIPTAPLNVTASAIDGAIIIDWSEPMDNGGSILTSFSISRAENDESIIMLASVDPSVHRYIDNTVVPGSSYSYYIQAINEPGASDYSDGSSPIIAYSLVQLDVGTDSRVSGLGIINTLMGSIYLVSNQHPVAGFEINLAYSVNNGIDWVALPTVVSSSDGSFNKSWIPTAEGVYLIRAVWAGDGRYPSVESIFSIAITISTQNEIFTVQSSSTISNLIFNSETKQLSFTVSGESGTSGYTRIVVSKELVANGSDIILTLDGADMNYELSSTATSWVLFFTYSHSSHNVVADLNSESELINPVNDDDPMLMIGAGLVVAIVLMLLAFVFYRRRR